MIIDPSSQQEFSDADFRIVDNGDQSKKLAFEVSAIAANTTRTITVPDANLTISSFIATLLDDTTAAAALTTLGITAGTYTPTVTPSGGSLTAYTASGAYVKFGSLGVLVKVVVSVSTLGTASGTATITLPFAPSGLSAGAGENSATGWALSVLVNTNLIVNKYDGFNFPVAGNHNFYAMAFYVL